MLPRALYKTLFHHKYGSRKFAVWQIPSHVAFICMVMSFIILFLHVILGLPLFLFSAGIQWSACPPRLHYITLQIFKVA